ncbi:MAG: DUF3726 domain-containing protein [Kiloniellaceae bacterium]
MIVTLNELERTCQRAMCALGAPAGVDEDAASAAAWLEARGLPALQALVRALDRWGGDPTAANLTDLSERSDTRRLDAAGRSAAFVAGAIIDIAVAAAAEHGGAATVTVEALADRQFLLPVADRRRSRGWSFRLLWGRRSNRPGAGARVDPDTGIRLFGDWNSLPVGEASDTTIACRKAPSTARPCASGEALQVTRQAADLDARLAAVLAAGLTVDDDVWRRLATHAKRALVPSSHDSRVRGAGPAASDNE